MKPSYSIKIDGVELASEYRKAFKSLSINDEVGFISDSLRLTFNDDGELDVPRAGSELIVSLGFGELSEMGRYTLDDASLSEGILSLSAKGFDSTKGIKSIDSFDFKTKSVFEAAQKIANNNGLKLYISDEYKAVETDKKIIQCKESSLHLLRRLAENFGAVVKIQGGKLLFLSDKQGKSVTGKELDILTIDKKMVTSWSMKYSGRLLYKSVSCQFLNPDTGKSETIKAGEGEPSLKFRSVFNDREKAIKAVNSKYKKSGFETKELNLSLPGDVNYKAETIVNLSGFRDGVNGKWFIHRATHNLSNSYITNLDLKIKKES